MAKGDMFLKMASKRAGNVKGEAQDAAHGGEMDVLAWSWSMDFPTDLRSGGRTGRASMRALCITKPCDVATTALMSIANTNDEITSAELNVRKAGGPAIDYLTVKLKKAYITAYEIVWQDTPLPQMVERFEMRFQTIEVNYSPQSSAGQKAGATSFTGQVTESGA
jgi:type VI secretion system secreted protein Hcp